MKGVTHEIIIVDGSIDVRLGNTAAQHSIASTGKHSFVVDDKGTGELSFLASSLMTTGYIDDVSCYQTDASGNAEILAQSGKGYPLRWGATLKLPASPDLNTQIGYKD